MMGGNDEAFASRPAIANYCSFRLQQIQSSADLRPCTGSRDANIPRMANKRLQPSPALLLKVESAFLAHGYRALTMEKLAGACKFSRRALYFYFRSKSDAFRAAVRFRNELALTAGLESGRKHWSQGGDALEILAAVINIRHGDIRRIANASAHLVE